MRSNHWGVSATPVTMVLLAALSVCFVILVCIILDWRRE